MTEEIENQKPYITIDGTRISVDELPEEAQGIFGRVQRLTQKRAIQTLDLEETQASINWFTSRIVSIVNGEEKTEDTSNKKSKSKK